MYKLYKSMGTFVIYISMNVVFEFWTCALKQSEPSVTIPDTFEPINGLNILQIEDGGGGGGEGGVPLPPLHEGLGGCCSVAG